MKTSPLMVSISGIRGIVGQSLTPAAIEQFAAAFAQRLKGSKVVVGRDSRPSGLALKHVLVGTLMSCGCDVIRLGVCPTPTVGMAVTHLKAAGGIVITASHNPIEWNALKLMNEKGLFFDTQQGEELVRFFNQAQFPYANALSFGSETVYEQACQDHIDRLMAALDVEVIRSAQLTVALDSVNGAGSEITPRFLELLGCRVISQNCDIQQPFPREPEPTSENLKPILTWVKDQSCDVAFVQDPDADRLAVIDSEGHYLGEELTLALALESVLSETDDAKAVVANVSSTLFLDQIANRYGVPMVRTKVGEAHVVQGMIEKDALIGGEGNGGVIYAKTHLGRDSLVGIGLILQLMARRQQSLQTIMQDWPQLHMVKHKVSMGREAFEAQKLNLKHVFDDAEESMVDGVKYTWNNCWLQLRVSNTEPIVRIFAEAQSTEKAQDLIDRAVHVLNGD